MIHERDTIPKPDGLGLRKPEREAQQLPNRYPPRGAFGGCLLGCCWVLRKSEVRRDSNG